MGRPITVSVPHKLGKSEARRRIEEGFSSIQRNQSAGLGGLLSVHERWEGDRLYFDAGGLGQKVSGRLDVLTDSVELQIEVPEMLALIADRILATLRTGTQKLLE
jgi:hypothetical protein